jgi:SAM-dependent methyltransferase
MLRSLKKIVSQTPVLGPVAASIYRGVRGGANPVFTNSGEYWDSRYKMGGNSGSGSYNELALFKADVLNEFVRNHHVSTVLEFGCGDGAQLGLAAYPDYVGFDVSKQAVEICRTRYRDDSGKRFFLIDAGQPAITADLTLSLDVIYHLVEDRTFDQHMSSLFNASRKYVAIYASNEDHPSSDPHVRHRRFVTWIEKQRPDWRQIGFVKNKYPWDATKPQQTSFADFYFFEKASVGAV